MNFNHLMEKRTLMRRCRAEDHQECYYEPVADSRATTGGNVHVQMKCRHCHHREDIFLSAPQYETHRKLLQRRESNV